RGAREEMQIAGMGFAKRRDSSTAATFCPAGRMRQALPAAISPPFRIKDTCRRRKRRLSHCRRGCAGAPRAEFRVAGFVRERRYRPCILAGTGQKVHSRIGRHSAAYSQTLKGDRVTHSLLSRHVAIAGAVVILGLPSALAAQPPTPQEMMHATSAGRYLAARHAGTERDSATAAAYYLNVLKADPRNADLL